ncbi:stage II sporulation protein P [Bacillus sp. 31A1R]|uniref:Stage II sporulation protein P n=1 Tax=Robertmurraya mangrovi TaxID=3098077 RepID=A0ABU5IYF2_9BACI|nr:stage II sporulation protein P [Bacillus sp. 31A1R]MDZ5472179.1 stage II sporulation protein P [Bacillus sp. 31A1R]
MKKMRSPFSFFRFLIHGFIFSILLPFLLAGVVTTYSAPFTSETLKSWFNNVEVNELFIHFIKAENHFFINKEEEIHSYSLSNITFKLATNIQPTDIRTFLGRELPGFSIFDTDILVAGEGTDYTNLPIESAPPMEVLLKEREIAKEQLGEQEEKPTVTGKETVLIYQTHSWEAYLPLLNGVTKPNEAVSSKEQANVVGVGKRLAAALQERGIGVIHDKTNMTEKLKNNGWNYYQSYTMSRNVVQETLATNEDLNFIIDIHRDAARKETTTKKINGKSYAKVWFVVGKDHKNYEQNSKIALELNKKLEEKYPGISRGVIAKGKSQGDGRYNQDLSARAMLVEFGGVDNDSTELQNTIEAFAEIFSEYYWKAEMVNG